MKEWIILQCRESKTAMEFPEYKINPNCAETVESLRKRERLANFQGFIKMAYADLGSGQKRAYREKLDDLIKKETQERG